MRKPNISLKFAAAAITAQRKAQMAKTARLRAYYTKQAQSYMTKAAKASDAGKAVRIIHASNASARRIGADFDDVEVDEVEVEADDLDMMDTDMVDDDIVLGSDDDDSDTEDDDEDEVDARLASVLARTRARRQALARVQAKRQLRR